MGKSVSELLKFCQRHEGLAPDLQPGVCSWTPLGAKPPVPQYRLALHARRE
jgi:hypothetical protein